MPFLAKNLHFLNSTTLSLAEFLLFTLCSVQTGFPPFKREKRKERKFCKRQSAWGSTLLCLTTKAIHFIRENLSARLRVGVVAEAMFVSISSLQKHFKKELGMSVGEYIERELFAEAEKYVLHTAKSVDQISTALHFCDATYFSKRFKQRFFKSPLQYRRAQAAK